MSTRYFLQLRCPAGHETETELLNAVLTPDGMIEGAAGSDSDFCAVCNEPPTVYGITERTDLCQSFLLCQNEATKSYPHPILGMVPSCQACADKLAAFATA